jgi:hypothetical protein
MARKPKTQKTEDFIFPKRDEKRKTEVTTLPLTGEEVLVLLNKKGLKTGKSLDDKLTKTAIKFFQKTNGLKITSDINDETLAKLKG